MIQLYGDSRCVSWTCDGINCPLCEDVSSATQGYYDGGYGLEYRRLTDGRLFAKMQGLATSSLVNCVAGHWHHWSQDEPVPHESLSGPYPITNGVPRS